MLGTGQRGNNAAPLLGSSPTFQQTRIQKNEARLRKLWDNLKHSHIWITGAPEVEEQEIKNLFEQTMKENFPKLVKEIDFQEVQEAQDSPK